MSDNGQAVTLIGQISKVQTLADGGMRYTFDGPEDAVMQSAALMEMKRLGYAVKLTIEPVTVPSRSDIDGLLRD